MRAPIRGLCLFLLALHGCVGAPEGLNRVPAGERSAQATALESDFDLLLGSPWAGSLTYLDYSSGRATTIRSTLAVLRLPRTAEGPAWELRVGYDDEPQENGSAPLILSAQGSKLGQASVVERQVLAGGIVRITTEEQGQDDERPALLKHVYLLGAGECSIQKLVRVTSTDEFFERNVYRWTR